MVTVAARAKGPKHPDLDYVLLSLIRMHPEISGYQLRSIINDSTGYFFHAHLSQIYPSLRRLNDAGLVAFEDVAREGKPDLKLYSITDAGIAVLHEWLVRPYEFETTRANADRYFMKLILMGHLDPDELEAYIDSGIEALSAQEQHIVDNNLQLELSFIANAEPQVKDRYQTLWADELSFMVRELSARVEWLRELKENLRGSAG